MSLHFRDKSPFAKSKAGYTDTIKGIVSFERTGSELGFYDVKTIHGSYFRVPSCVGQCLKNDSVTMLFQDPDAKRNPVIIDNASKVTSAARQRISGLVDLGPWTQAEGSHLRSNSTVSPARLRLFGNGQRFKILKTIAGTQPPNYVALSLSFGLLAVSWNGKICICVSYPEYAASAITPPTNTPTAKMIFDVYDPATGQLLQTWSRDFVNERNFSKETMSFDSDRSTVHVWPELKHEIDSAWKPGTFSALTASSEFTQPRNDNSFVSSCGNKILLTQYGVDYSQIDIARRKDIVAQDPYYPPHMPAFGKVVTGGIRGFELDKDNQLVQKFEVDIQRLSTLSDPIIAGLNLLSNPNKGWAALPDKSAWLIAVSSRSALQLTSAARFALAGGYRSRQPANFAESVIWNNTFEIQMARSLLGKQIEATVVAIDTVNGNFKWRWSKKYDATSAITYKPEELNKPFAQYADEYYSNGGGALLQPASSWGVLSENQVEVNGSTFGSNPGQRGWDWVYTGITNIATGYPPYPALPDAPVDYVCPDFHYYNNNGIFFYPRPTTNNPQLGNYLGYDAPHCQNNRNNLAVFNAYLNDVDGVKNSPCSVSDLDGNSYFVYSYPEFLLTCQNTYETSPREDTGLIETPHYVTPILSYVYRTVRISLTKTGTLRWSQDISRFHKEASIRTTQGLFFIGGEAQNQNVGGKTNTKIPLADNHWIVCPVGNSLGVTAYIMDVHAQGPDFRPTTICEIVENKSGKVLQQIHLTYSDEKLTENIMDGGTLVAQAGDLRWEINGANVKVKGAYDRSNNFYVYILAPQGDRKGVLPTKDMLLLWKSDQSEIAKQDLAALENPPDFNSIVLTGEEQFWMSYLVVDYSAVPGEEAKGAALEVIISKNP